MCKLRPGWAGKYKFGARAGKYKFGARAGKYKFGASVGKYKLGARAGKYKFGARAGGQGQGREIQIPDKKVNANSEHGNKNRRPGPLNTDWGDKVGICKPRLWTDQGG